MKMPNIPGRFRQDIPARFLFAIALAGGLMAFLTVDQIHWWQLKPDYVFGWLVPAFVLYLIVERWPKLQEIFRSAGASPLTRWQQQVVALAVGGIFLGGLIFFLLGSAYRAGSGATQPGSLALAAGFSGILLGMIYFNVPDGRVGEGAAPVGWRAVRADARLQATMLFLFPAMIWMLSAPLVSSVENSISLFLLRKVVAVVFTVFSLLGYPLVQEGNVLLLPHGQVGVADACSGIRSLTACLFAGSFLAAVSLDRWWKKLLLVASAMAFAFLTNLLRSLFLTAWAYAYGSEAIEGQLHDLTGFAVLGLTCAGLFCLLPFFQAENWRRWLQMDSATGATSNHNG